MIALRDVLAPPGGRRSWDDALVTQGASFWEHVYPMFLARDITRHDLRQLVGMACGNHKAVTSRC